MKALTLHQPWASLIRDERKLIETRSWRTDYRGTLAIHAGNTVNKEACIRFGYDPDKILTGAVLCIVNLKDCVKVPNDSIVPDEYGDFSDGRYGWILEMLKVLKKPIPAKGNRMLWNFTKLKEPKIVRKL